MNRLGLILLILAALPALPVLFAVEPARAQAQRTGPSGLALPRFVSLKSDKVNVRVGPSRDHDIAWTFVKEGLPVEIIQEFDNWRRIRDHAGDDGWIFHKLLSGRRTALVDPERAEGTISLYREASSDSDLAAWLEPRVIVNVSSCDGTWCRVEIDSVTGWVDQASLYGVYPGEAF
ncbi:MAG: SH3 domain-containing protein [Pseudomonadota bacterium]